MSDISPYHLNMAKEYISKPLSIIYNTFLESDFMVESWLEAKLFFNHKDGDRDNPDNDRSIAIGNAFMKAFSYLITRRIFSLYA